MQYETVKVVFTGQAGVGKKSLIMTIGSNSFPHDYTPCVIDNHSLNMMVDGLPASVSLWHTAGQSDYDRLRPLSYPNTDVFLHCFDLSNRASFENLKCKYYPETQYHEDKAPFLLVGTKLDKVRALAEGEAAGAGAGAGAARREAAETVRGAAEALRADARELARGIGAYKYVEVAAIEEQFQRYALLEDTVRCFRENRERVQNAQPFAHHRHRCAIS